MRGPRSFFLFFGSFCTFDSSLVFLKGIYFSSDDDELSTSGFYIVFFSSLNYYDLTESEDIGTISLCSLSLYFRLLTLSSALKFPQTQGWFCISWVKSIPYSFSIWLSSAIAIFLRVFLLFFKYRQSKSIYSCDYKKFCIVSSTGP